jgi:hypothetical protein
MDEPIARELASLLHDAATTTPHLIHDRGVCERTDDAVRHLHETMGSDLVGRVRPRDVRRTPIIARR